MTVEELLQKLVDLAREGKGQLEVCVSTNGYDVRNPEVREEADTVWITTD